MLLKSAALEQTRSQPLSSLAHVLPTRPVPSPVPAAPRAAPAAGLGKAAVLTGTGTRAHRVGTAATGKAGLSPTPPAPAAQALQAATPSRHNHVLPAVLHHAGLGSRRVPARGEEQGGLQRR